MVDAQRENIVNQIENNLNGNDFDEDLFLDLLLDQMKAKIKRKELAPKWGDFTIFILHQFDLQKYPHVTRGFLRRFALIHCMHWDGKNCLVGWQGQYEHTNGKMNIILELVVNQS